MTGILDRPERVRNEMGGDFTSPSLVVSICTSILSEFKKIHGKFYF